MIRLWSKKILRVLEVYSGSGLRLIGATGDIDNLGLFVASNGRAKAENLVDIVNHVVGDSLNVFFDQRSNDFPVHCLLPAGEELLILAVCHRKTAFEDFSAHLSSMTEAIHRCSPIPASSIGISFGTKIFKKKFVHGRVRNLIRAVYASDNSVANTFYLDIMHDLRHELAEDLDRQKFHSLQGGRESPTMYRNLVYQETIEYKYRAKETLLRVREKLALDPVLRRQAQKSAVSRHHGLDGNDLMMLKKLKG
jgi:hypothetical protein